MKQKRARATLPRLNWRPGDPLATGSRQWFTRDGSFRMIASEIYEGITLPRLWLVYVWKCDGWRKIGERRSQHAADKLARQRAAAWENEE